MLNFILVVIGKSIIFFSQTFNLGNGSTWPGHIALKFNKHFIKNLLEKSRTKIIFIAGTNGKTTTAKILETILSENDKKVFQNISGANLLNGIASSMVLHSSIFCSLDYDYAIFEIDENSLPHALRTISPNLITLNNLFRDQLDRYGEIDTIAKKWKKEIDKLSPACSLILNADDPQIAYLGKETKADVVYFGLNEANISKNQLDHASDSTYCPNCQSKLNYSNIYFSHLGDWNCPICKEKRPKISLSSLNNYPLSGLYNKYNTLAAALAAKRVGTEQETIDKALKNFQPAFGRQEVLDFNGKKVQIFLSKNPTSFNQSLNTIKELGSKHLLIVLNNRIPDGRDVSWIWDIDLELEAMNVTVSGDKAYDMGLRIKYDEKVKSSKLKVKNDSSKFKIIENLKEAIKIALEQVWENETLYILPTYSAMLEVRKILTGRKIL